MSQSARKAFQKLQDLCIQQVIGTKGDRIHQFRARYGPILDYMKPGYLINRLTPEERESLKDLTDVDVKAVGIRPDSMLW